MLLNGFLGSFVTVIQPRAPCTQYHTCVGPQPLYCLQMLISVNIFLEGNKGVKERSLQIDQLPKSDYFYFTKNDYFPALFHQHRSMVPNLQE